MYRNKIITFAVGMLVLLIGAMVWSSHIVADDHAKRQEAIEQEAAQEEEVLTEFEQEHKEQFEEELAMQEETYSELPEEAKTDPVYIDTSEVQPTISKRYIESVVVKPHYLDRIKPKKLTLWNLTKLPLKVYLRDRENMPHGFATAIETAFLRWQNLTSNTVRFVFVEDTEKNNPDIIVEVIDKPETSCENDPEADFVKKFTISQGMLRYAELKISKESCDGSMATHTGLYGPLQHQVGHILGIAGHSARIADVMYPEMTYENSTITDIDANTLMMLYKFAPEITNKYYQAPEKAKLWNFARIQGKSNEEITDFLRKALQDPNAKLSPIEAVLKSAYEEYQNENYGEAIKNYKKAAGLAENVSDKAYVNRALAICYLSLGNMNNAAYMSAMEAYNIVQTPENEYLMAYVKFMTGNERESLKHIQVILDNYPKIRPAYSVAAKIYQKGGRKIELKELAKKAAEQFPHNPPVVVNFPEDKTPEMYNAGALNSGPIQFEPEQEPRE